SPSTTTRPCRSCLRSDRRPATCSRSSSRPRSSGTSRGADRRSPTSAVSSALSRVAGGVLSAGSIPEVMRTWWLGDATGALIVVPLALAWWPPPLGRARVRLPEATLMLLAVVALSEVGSRARGPLVYLVFPVLIWAGLRLGARGATLAIATTAGVFVWNTTHYGGAFHFHSITR